MLSRSVQAEVMKSKGGSKKTVACHDITIFKTDVRNDGTKRYNYCVSSIQIVCMYFISREGIFYVL